MNSCKICGNNKNNAIFKAREMMFGTGEEFEYLKCHICGCLQIKEIPPDMTKYYPDEYNAFDPVIKTTDLPLKKYLKLQKSRYCLRGKFNPLGILLSWIYGCEFSAKLKKACVDFDDKILDIGTGNGRRLVGLCREGFSNLTGIDPFIDSDIFYDNGVRVLKKDLFDLSDTFDFIMLNHAFEHVPNPFEVLTHIRKILNPDKFVMIRTPVVDSYSWYKYRENWVAFDAPRHLFIYNQNSIKIVAEKTGFKLVDILYDSSEYQFWGSEQYLNGIPMRDDRSYYDNPVNSMFTRQQIKKYKKHAAKLNKENKGDAACFYLRKTG